MIAVFKKPKWDLLITLLYVYATYCIQHLIE